MGRELELKYRADDDRLAAIEALYGDFTPITMETTYYDTPAADLRRLHWTLRRRFENGRSVCTLKTPLPDGSRGEWETESPSIEEAIPMLCNLGAPELLVILTEGGVAPYCGAKFLRLAKLLTLEHASVELALDKGVLLGSGKEEAFAEVEAEYKGGSEEAAVAFAETLARQFGLIPESRSKVVRAMALAQTT